MPPTPRLNTAALRAAADRAGDDNSTAISRRTGVCESSLSRLIRGQSTPALATLLRLRSAYKVTLDDLIDDTEAAA